MKKQDLKQREIPILNNCHKRKNIIENSILHFSNTTLNNYKNLGGREQQRMWREFLNKKSDNEQLCIIEQPGLGNCLFESLSSYIPNKNHIQIRNEIIDYERKNSFQWIEFLTDPDNLSLDDDQNEQYIQHLRQKKINNQQLKPEERVELYLKVMNTQ